MKCRIYGVIVIGLFVLISSGCRQQPPSGESRQRLPIAVSIAPQAWLVGRIGGEHVEVFAIVRAGESSATYQPTDVQVTEVMRAAAYFRIGVPFENGPWFRSILQVRNMPVIDFRDGIELRRMEVHSHHDDAESAGEGEPVDGEGWGDDPHIWLSPRLLRIQARTVAEALSELDPDHRADYELALNAVDMELQKLDATLRERLEPIQGRVFLVFHPAWGYFSDEYGLEQLAVEIEGKEPGDADLTRLQREAREAGARVLFVQRQISPRSARAVAEAIGGRVEILDPLAGDVAANLLRVAEALVESSSDTGEHNSPTSRD